jgi:hypothetical protein
MGRKTLLGSALWRVLALLCVLCAPWGVARAGSRGEDSRADVAAKLARIEELLKTKVKQGKGWAAAQKPLDKEVAEIELWLIGETGKPGPKDRAATVKTVGLVVLEARPPAWATEVGMSIQTNAAEVLGRIVPEGAPALLAGTKNLNPNNDPTQIGFVYKNIGRQGTKECLDALVAAAALKEESYLQGASDGLGEFPAPSAAQRKTGFGALLEGWVALDAERVKKKEKPLEDTPGYEKDLLPHVRAALTKLSGQALVARKDWEAWWKDHKKGDWK